MLEQDASKRPDPHRQRRGSRTPGRGIVVLLLLMAVAILALAIPALADQAGGDVEDALDRLESRFDVYRLADGYAVRVPQPERPADGHGDPGALLEIRGGQVSRAGVDLDDALLDDWLGIEARRALRTLADWSGEQVSAERPPRPKPAPVPVPAPEPKAQPSPERGESLRIVERGSAARVFGDVHIDRDERAEEAIAFGGDVTVEGVVRKDVVAVGGNVQVDGTVRGDVTAVRGSVRLGSRARVEGEVMAIGGSVKRETGARVDGRIREVRPGRALDELVPRLPRAPEFHVDWPRPDSDGVFDRVSNAMILIAITVLLSVVTAAPIEEFRQRLRRAPLRAGGVGFATQLAIVPATLVIVLVFVLTIVGIPVLLLVLPTLALTLLVISVFGYAAVASACGRWVGRRLGRNGDGPFIAAVLGVMAIQGWSLAGEVFDGWFFPFGLTGDLLLAFGWVVRYAAWTFGLGVVVLALIGRQRQRNATS